MLSQVDCAEIGMTPQIGCKITKNYRNNDYFEAYFIYVY